MFTFINDICSTYRLHLYIYVSVYVRAFNNIYNKPDVFGLKLSITGLTTFIKSVLGMQYKY